MTLWRVIRLDDNGHRYLMAECESQDEAQRIVDEFVARGHKQSYWVEQVAKDEPRDGRMAGYSDLPWSSPCGPAGGGSKIVPAIFVARSLIAPKIGFAWWRMPRPWSAVGLAQRLKLRSGSVASGYSARPEPRPAGPPAAVSETSRVS